MTAVDGRLLLRSPVLFAAARILARAFSARPSASRVLVLAGVLRGRPVRSRSPRVLDDARRLHAAHGAPGRRPSDSPWWSSSRCVSLGGLVGPAHGGALPPAAWIAWPASGFGLAEGRGAARPGARRDPAHRAHVGHSSTRIDTSQVGASAAAGRRPASSRAARPSRPPRGRRSERVPGRIPRTPSARSASARTSSRSSRTSSRSSAAGGRAIGLCPFHAEKTPSFTVNEERGFFHCFGCGEHGDVFTFVMKTQSLPFPEAVRVVARALRRRRCPRRRPAPRPRGEPLVGVNEAAAAFFRRRSARPGRRPARGLPRRARHRRRDDRALRPRLCARRRRRAGAPPARPQASRSTTPLDRRTRHAPRRPAGLYDRFRDRLMFPIADRRGRVIAFGGRILPGAAGYRRPAAQVPELPRVAALPEGAHAVRSRPGARRHPAARARRRRRGVPRRDRAGAGGHRRGRGAARHRAHRRSARVARAASPNASSPASTATPPGGARPRGASRCSSRPGSGAAASSCPPATIPTRSSARTAASASLALLETAEPLIDAWLRGTRSVRIATRSAGVPRRRARWRASCSACARDPDECDVARRLARRRPRRRREAAARRGRRGRRAGAVARRRDSGAAPRARRSSSSSSWPRDPDVAERVRRRERRRRVRAPRVARRRRAPAGGAARRSPPSGSDGLPRELRDRVVRRLLDRRSTRTERDQVLADCIAAIRARRSRQARGRLLERSARRGSARRRRGCRPGATPATRVTLTEKTRT